MCKIVKRKYNNPNREMREWNYLLVSVFILYKLFYVIDDFNKCFNN